MKVRHPLCLLLGCIIASGCAALSQGMRGQPQIPKAAKHTLHLEYVGKWFYLRQDKYDRDEWHDQYMTSAIFAEGHAYHDRSAYKLVLPAWSRVRVLEILFGQREWNFVTVEDQAGKKYYGLRLVVPDYPPRQVTKPDFAITVLADYRFELAKWFSDVDKNALLRRYAEKYGPDVATAILDHRIFVGMPDSAVIKSIGKPTEVSRVVSAGGSSEQWFYGTLLSISLRGGTVESFVTHTSGR